MTWEVATFIQFVSLVAWVPGWRNRLGRRRANVRGCDERIVDIVLQVREARDDGCWLYLLLVVRVIRKSTLSKRTHLDGHFIPSIFPSRLICCLSYHDRHPHLCHFRNSGFRRQVSLDGEGHTESAIFDGCYTRVRGDLSEE